MLVLWLRILITHVGGVALLKSHQPMTSKICLSAYDSKHCAINNMPRLFIGGFPNFPWQSLVAHPSEHIKARIQSDRVSFHVLGGLVRPFHLGHSFCLLKASPALKCLKMIYDLLQSQPWTFVFLCESEVTVGIGRDLLTFSWHSLPSCLGKLGTLDTLQQCGENNFYHLGVWIKTDIVHLLKIPKAWHWWCDSLL